jgi:ubiquitin carboxyl-terminal hydrolase L3
MAAEKDPSSSWIPLESNPEVLSRFAQTLGVPDAWCLSDVWSPEPDLLALVPAPCRAVIFLFPLTEAVLAAERARAEAGPRPVIAGDVPYFCKQTIGNACGLIALIHTVLNNHGEIKLEQDSFFDKFYRKTRSMSPDERAVALESETSLRDAHRGFAEQGQTRAPDPDEKVDLHFVAFVEHAGTLYELDGRKAGPVRHGVTTPDSVLFDACKVIKTFMAADPSEMRYTILALTANVQS